ncbi:30S ribosomal protein S27ae [Candidatus Bathyarchaeota archaeon]|nr:30S ribosomal protein S27ae [Candidatus Bathyarchaeota archaeon]
MSEGIEKQKEKKREGVWSYYEVREGKLSRKLKACPRCGCFMARHPNRLACGKCGYTEFTKKSK